MCYNRNSSINIDNTRKKEKKVKKIVFPQTQGKVKSSEVTRSTD